MENEKGCAEKLKGEGWRIHRMTSMKLRKTPITSMMGMIDGMIYGVREFRIEILYLHKCREILEETIRSGSSPS